MFNLCHDVLIVDVTLYLVKNHGISQELIDNAVEAGKKFFALPEEEKMKVRDVLTWTK